MHHGSDALDRALFIVCYKFGSWHFILVLVARLNQIFHRELPCSWKSSSFTPCESTRVGSRDEVTAVLFCRIYLCSRLDFHLYKHLCLRHLYIDETSPHAGYRINQYLDDIESPNVISVISFYTIIVVNFRTDFC